MSSSVILKSPRSINNSVRNNFDDSVAEMIDRDTMSKFFRADKLISSRNVSRRKSLSRVRKMKFKVWEVPSKSRFIIVMHDDMNVVGRKARETNARGSKRTSAMDKRRNESARPSGASDRNNKWAWVYGGSQSDRDTENVDLYVYLTNVLVQFSSLSLCLAFSVIDFR